MRWTILSISPYQAHIYIYGASCRTNGLRMDNIASLLSVNWLVMWHIELQWGDLWRVQINIVGRMKRTDVWNDEELKKEEEKADQEKMKQLDNSWEKKTGLHICVLYLLREWFTEDLWQLAFHLITWAEHIRKNIRTILYIVSRLNEVGMGSGKLKSIKGLWYCCRRQQEAKELLQGWSWGQEKQHNAYHMNDNFSMEACSDSYNKVNRYPMRKSKKKNHVTPLMYLYNGHKIIKWHFSVHIILWNLGLYKPVEVIFSCE